MFVSKTMNDSIRKYFLSYRTVLKMLKFRGYKIPKSHDVDPFLNELFCVDDIDELKKLMSFSAKKISDHSKLKIIWIPEQKVGAPTLKELYNKFSDEGVTRAILIAEAQPTSPASGMLMSIRNAGGCYIETFTLSETVMFVLDHELVPIHEVCSLEEKEEIFNSMGIIRSFAIVFSSKKSSLRNEIMELLMRLNFYAISCLTEKECISAMDNRRPDLVIVDFSFIDFETIEFISNLDENIPIVFVALSDDIRRGKRLRKIKGKNTRVTDYPFSHKTKNLLKSVVDHKNPSKKLPNILLSDICIRHIGALEGDLIKIYRKNTIDPDLVSPYYRLVV